MFIQDWLFVCLHTERQTGVVFIRQSMCGLLYCIVRTIALWSHYTATLLPTLWTIFDCRLIFCQALAIINRRVSVRVSVDNVRYRIVRSIHTNVCEIYNKPFN